MFNLKVFLLLIFCTAQLYAIPPDMLKGLASPVFEYVKSDFARYNILYVTRVGNFGSQILPEEVIELIYSLRAICTKKVGLTNDDIENYVITNTDEKFKCYMNCMLLESKWMSPEGKIHFESILDNCHADIKPVLEKLFEKCDNVPDSTEPCGKAYNFNACVAAADPQHYFLP